MAGSRSKAAKGKRSNPGPGEYAREAVTEWGKALRYAKSALQETFSTGLKDRLAPTKTALDLGGRVVERITANGHGPADHDVPIPIQESMEVAVPVKVAYDLATRFEDYPEFIDRLESVEEI